MFFFIVGYALVRNDLVQCSSEPGLAFKGMEVIDLPGGCAMLRILTQKESDLFQAVREGVFGGHGAT